jgi:DNA primase
MDFAELKAKVSITDVLSILNIDLQRVKQHGDQLRGTCPIHGGDNPRGFVITPGKGLWFCFSGCGGGDVIALVAKVRQLSIKDAAEWIARAEQLPVTVPVPFHRTRKGRSSPSIIFYPSMKPSRHSAFRRRRRRLGRAATPRKALCVAGTPCRYPAYAGLFF